jgi:hypothetical protein
VAVLPLGLVAVSPPPSGRLATGDCLDTTQVL